MHCQFAKQHALDYETERLAPTERQLLAEHLAGCTSCARIYPRYVESTCAWMLDFLADYLDASLAPPERDVFEWHLEACPECRRYLASYAAAIVAARGSRQLGEPLPNELVDAILRVRRNG